MRSEVQKFQSVMQMRRHTFNRALGSRRFGAAILIAAIAVGCQSAHVQHPLTSNLSGNDAHTRAEFWSQLANRPVTSNDDACHAILLYVDGTDRSADYPARVSELKKRSMLPADFNKPADDAVDRGTLAVALVHTLKIDGGLTMQLFGANPRYAVRALEYRGVYPASSPNQGVSGGEFIGIMQKAEEFQYGNPADAPAAFLPNEIRHEGAPPVTNEVASQTGPAVPDFAADEDAKVEFAVAPAAAFNPDLSAAPVVAMSLDDVSRRNIFRDDPQTWYALSEPLFLDDLAGPATAPAAAGPKHLNVIVTGVQGELAEVRKSQADPWARARIGMVVHDSAEFRTGPKSAIRFIIPADQTFCVDSQSTIKVIEAVADGRKLKTDIALAHGRVRYDVDKIKPSTRPAGQVQIEEAGIEHDATIRSPNTALALRGTKVSLFDQPSFTPQAVSLTGRAIYINTNGERVPFGGRARAAVRGGQSSAAQSADADTQPPRSAFLARTDFETREISIVTQRGGFIRGDVIVGDLHLSDFKTLPGALDFVLQWSGTPQRPLNDLNLAVFSPLNTTSSPDFVANAPFTVSLTPNSPASRQLRATNYPQSSRSGGHISLNSVGPAGLELASWGRNHPVGNYQVVVFNLVDAKPPPTQTTDPVTYTIDVLLNGHKLINTFTGSVGLLQTSGALQVPVPATTASAAATRKPARVAAQRRPLVRAR
jgi:hypothetical protein